MSKSDKKKESKSRKEAKEINNRDFNDDDDIDNGLFVETPKEPSSSSRKKERTEALLSQMNLLTSRLEALEKLPSQRSPASDSDSDESEEEKREERRDERRDEPRSFILPSSSSVQSLLPPMKFDKARNQFEYDFLSEIAGIIQDTEEGLSFQQKLILISEAVQARAAILITAQEEGWGVATEMDLFDSPKKAFLRRYQKTIDGARKRYSSKVSSNYSVKKETKRKAPSARVITPPTTVIAPSSSSSTTKGACYICGSPSHYANKCPQKASNLSSAGGSSSRAGGGNP